MTMASITRSAFNRSLNSPHIPWPLTLVLVIGVMLPTACVIWFMGEAVKNERLAVHRKVEELYLRQLEDIATEMTQHLSDRLAQGRALAKQFDGSNLFFQLIKHNIASSAIIFNEENIQTYPIAPKFKAFTNTPSLWLEAEQLEFQQQEYTKASQIFSRIATQHQDPRWQAKAIVAQARCLAKSGKPGKIDKAVALLSTMLFEERFSKIYDEQGRSIRDNAQLYALTLLKNNDKKDHEKFESIMQTLVASITDYQTDSIPASQRIFIMRELLDVDSSLNFSTLEAEQAAAKYLQAQKENDFLPNPVSIRESGSPGIYHVLLNDAHLTLLFTEDFFRQSFHSVLQDHSHSEEMSFKLIPPANHEKSQQTWLTIPITELLPGWHIGISFENASPFNAAADKQISTYLWTGVLIVVSIIALALVTAHYISVQIRKNRYKNDLMATVSHELKTPLSSIRLLVETLLQDAEKYDNTTHEYLELISRENTRLSQLIDNFLTFSRMERNKQTYHFTQVLPKDIAESASLVLTEKFKAAHVLFEIKLTEPLSAIYADKDMLVMALTNLLENAYKYSGEEKYIILHVFENNDGVNFAVQDFGIGIARRNSRKIFDRFYRVNNTLTQEADGCGLGLNIVDTIAREHRGKVFLESVVGEGSTFTLCIPALVKLDNGK